MARQARLVLAGELHHAMLCAKPGLSPMQDAVVRHRAVAVLRDESQRIGVSIHGFAVLPDACHALLTPPGAHELSRFMQSCARQISASVPQAVTRGGSVWGGRYRAGLVAPDRALEVLFAFDGLLEGSSSGGSAREGIKAFGSAAHCEGRLELPWLKPIAALWALGNTPFARQAQYLARREAYLALQPPTEVIAAARHGWALAGGEWLAEAERRAGRALKPKSPGRKPSDFDLSPIDSAGEVSN